MKTLIILKPDCLERRIQFKVMEEICKDFIVDISRTVISTREQVEEHYAEHKEKPFFKELVDFMSDKKVWVLVCQHKEMPEDSVALMRKLVGPTDGSDKKSIRGKFKLRNSPMMKNIIHASDSNESVEREIKIWIKQEDYKNV